METAGRLHSTAPDDVPLGRIRRARRIRRLFITLLVIFLALGVAGVWGVRTGTVRASGAGYDLAVEYARVTRPGLATPWSVEVHRAGGFDGPVTVAVDGDYLDMFDENGLDPEPSSSAAGARQLLWEFDPPPGDTLTITLDARLEPGVQWGRRGSVALLVDDEPAVSVRFRTWVLP